MTMKRWLGMFLCLLSFHLYADSGNCPRQVDGYRIVPGSIFEFSKENKECFFAFYTENPDKSAAGTDGCGNFTDAVWYAHISQLPNSAVQEFPKPEADDASDWQIMNKMAAVSFQDINGDKKPDVIVVGSNDQCTTTFNRPFVFLNKGNHFDLDYSVTMAFSGHNLATVADVKKYIKTGHLPKNDTVNLYRH